MLRYIENHLEKQTYAAGRSKKQAVGLGRLQDSLLTLWLCMGLAGDNMEASHCDFANAYIQGKTVTRPKPRRRTVAEDIHTGIFITLNRSSQRAASEPRDYIYAMMPPFPWYNYPPNAENMAFGEIFLDLYNQAAESRHTFVPKFTASMIQSSAADISKTWLPSKQQPDPECLGDFLKLLGHRLDTDTPDNGSCDHATTSVRVLAIEGDTNFDVLPMIQSAIKFSKDIWRDCFIGGELSKYGSYLDSDWETDIPNATHEGCSPNPEKSIDPSLRAIEDDDPKITLEGSSIGLATIPARLGSISRLSTADHHIDYVPILEHSRGMLAAAYYVWISTYPRPDHKTRFEKFQHEMKSRWSKQLLHTLTLLTAMVNCQIGLSAAEWVRRYFVPVLIQYDKDNVVLGLLAKHARPSKKQRSKLMLSVGRHVQRKSLGKDLVLFDLAAPSAPVGIIPDFRYGDETEEEVEKRMRVLYRGLGGFDDSGTFKLAYTSPESYAATMRKRMQEGTVNDKD